MKGNQFNPRSKDVIEHVPKRNVSWGDVKISEYFKDYSESNTI